jgi:hypothetical protein
MDAMAKVHALRIARCGELPPVPHFHQYPAAITDWSNTAESIS